MSPDRRSLAIVLGRWPAVDEPTTLEVYGLPHCERSFVLQLPRGSLEGKAAFSADSSFLAVCCTNYLAIIDLARQEIIQELAFNNHVKSVDYSSDGRLMACCTGDGETYIYDAKTYSPLRLPLDTDASKVTMAVRFSPDADIMATVGKDGALKLWDARSFKPLQTTETDSALLIHVAFSPDGRRLLTTGVGGHLRLFDVASGEQLLKLTVGRDWPANGQFSADGTSIVAGSGSSVTVFSRCRSRST